MINHKMGKLIFLAIVAVAFFLRFYQLGNIPSGLTNDEANKGYEAYSILRTGRDQWANPFPLVNFKGFGDYPPPVYIYSIIPSVLLFDLNQFSVRLISALAGVLSVVVIYFLGKKLFGEKIGILSSFFLGVMPWAIGLSRIGIESNLAILFLISSLFFGIKPKTIKQFFFSVFLLILLMYTYSGYALFSPIVFLVLLFFMFKEKKIKIKDALFVIFLFFIFSIPLYVGGSASARFSQVGILNNINSIGFMADLNTQRGQCLEVFPNLVCRIVDNKLSLFTSIFFKNLASHFSPNFLYISGTVTQYSILAQRGLDYLFNSLFLVLGFFYLLRKNKDYKLSIIFIVLFLLSAVPDSLTGDGNYSRASLMQPFIAIFNGLGFSYFISQLAIIKNIKLRYIISSIVGLVLIFSVCSFFVNYITYFKNNYSIFSQYGYENLMTVIAKKKSSYDRIYISTHLNDTKQYIYYLFYNKYDPKKYQNKERISYSLDSNGWISIDRIENIYFIKNIHKVSKDSSLSKKKILLISNPSDFPKDVEPIFETKEKLGNVIFRAINLSDLLKYNMELKKLRTYEDV